MTNNPADQTIREAGPPGPSPAPHPARIGPYRILRVLGQGGMGVVYEAEQLEPLRRMVALKVVRHGLDTREVLARFESERQALAVMDHPNIAKALDAGTTDAGLPYFVMELVPGLPITEYCDNHRLDTRRRLELVIAVCQGVQHAHQKGVIHRDLKPSNILVREQDGKPVPTIIDFGIAKATEHKLSAGALTTELGVAVGTPVYMSPEQAEASGLDIDTRADIYSLGIVLYQLVTGVLPFEIGGLAAGPFLRQYVLGHQEVPTPSRRVGGMAQATATPIAQQRRTTPVELRRELKGDLDWVILKAIDRDRTRRYETANALSLDLQRYLESKPVAARQPTALYTLGKFARRHRLGVAVSAAAALALVGVAIAMTVLADRIARERNRATLEGAKAQAISSFLEDMLKSADPWQGGARQTTVVEALKAGVSKLEAGHIQDPLVVGTIRRTIGTVYLGLGRTAEADTLLRAAQAEAARSGPESEEVARSLSDLGNLYIAEGKFDSAGPPLLRALDLRRKLGGPGDTLVATSLLNLGDLAHSRGEYRREDSLARAALPILRKAFGERHLAVANALRRIVSAQHALENYQESEAVARETAEMLRQLGMGRSVEMAAVLGDLGLSRADQKDYAEAESLLTQVVALDSVNFGPMHPDLAADLENLGYVYFEAGRYDDDVAVLKQTLAIRRAMLPDNHQAIGRTLFNIGATLEEKGDLAAAEPLYEEAHTRLRRALGATHPDVVLATWVLGRNQYKLGRRAQAEANLRAALAVHDPDGRLQPSDYGRVASVLVSLLIDQRRYAEAEPVGLRVLAVRDSLADSTKAMESRAQLVKLYQEWGKPDRAAKFRQ
ncbi:MAG: tetratricopeptide repeat protein [Gemmatimonadales bacterium]